MFANFAIRNPLYFRMISFSSHQRDLVIFFSFFLVSTFAAAQTDTIYFNQHNIIVGEVKEMNRGVLTVKTAYSDSDFKIEWTKVKGFKSDKYFNVALINRYTLQHVQLNSIADGKISLTSEEGNQIVDIEDIVYIRRLKDGFLDKVSASIDIAYILTKSNDLQQFNMRSALGYTSKKWVFGASYNQVRSTQKTVDPTKRMDAGISANRELKHGFFLGSQIHFLSNTEQLIDLRTTGVLGAGYYISRTNNMYWNGFLGLAFNNEDYIRLPNTEEPNENKTSYEAAIATELSLYDIGDLKLLTNAVWYPSLTEAGRHRVDLKFDVKYDLPFDFYIKTGITLNYDNQPTTGASSSDYIFQTGFGWEL